MNEVGSAEVPTSNKYFNEKSLRLKDLETYRHLALMNLFVVIGIHIKLLFNRN